MTGVYGVSFLIAFANVVFYRYGGGQERRRRYPLKALACSCSCWSAPSATAFSALKTPEQGEAAAVLLVQGNIPQDVKWDPAYQESTVATYERLSRKACSGGTAGGLAGKRAPFYFQGDVAYAARIKSLAAELKTYMISAARPSKRTAIQIRYLNSAFLLPPDGEVLGTKRQDAPGPFR